ncbi:hypothetical protein N9N99_02390 [Gammaproteobacteria bacterium]|nr:hypothetical protein [Gammaproteobacteria bacterium]
MKKLYLLSILFIVSCASVTGGFPKDTIETSIERATRCYYENYNEYWGNCWIEESKEEPTFEEWVEYLKMEKSWYMLQGLNDKLLIGLETNATNITEANRIFGIAVTDIDAIVNATIQVNIKEAELRRQQIAIALIAMGQALQDTGGGYQGYNTARGQTGFLESDYVSGFNKICIYDGISGTFTKVISSTSLCPLSSQQ